MKRTKILAVLAALLLMPVPALAEGLAILPVKLLDTSHEAQDQRGDHARRLELMAGVLAQEMPGRVIAPEAVAKACPDETAECLVTMLRDEGADRGLFIVVQKSSTLILQVFTDLMDVKAQKLIAHRELNFRGDNDESWRRAARFLADVLTNALAAQAE